MNWISNKPFPKNSTIQETHDMCEHVAEDNRLAVWQFCEDDSFGPVVRMVVCKECKDEWLKAEAEEEEPCFDCHQMFMMKDLKKWKDFYFDVRQGDEPLLICKDCCEKETHLERIKKYNADRDSELGDEIELPDWFDEYPDEDYSDDYPEEEELDEDYINELIFSSPTSPEERDHEFTDDGINDKD